MRAAASLAGYPNLPLNEADKKSVEAANKEYLASLTARPDQWSSHYNLGNYYLNRNEPKQAIASYDTALKLEPRAVLAMVNESMAYARLGENKKAEESLKKALKVAPDNAAANFNMGLLKAEQNDPKGAEQYLKKALKADPQMAQAAYNLCIITSKDRINEAVSLVPEGSRTQAAGTQVCLYACFLSQSEGRQGRGGQDVKGTHREVSGVQRCRDASRGNIEKGEKAIEWHGRDRVLSLAELVKCN